MELNLTQLNKNLDKKNPKEVIQWALSIAKKPVITTNFRPYESAILYAVVSEEATIPVIWCDTGYNTPQTYKFANNLINSLQLNIKLYVPKQTVAYRDSLLGLPTIDDPLHKEFTQQVKIEPFTRAMREHQPDVWFTNLRKGQTKFRDSIDILSYSKDGILKVSPFYYFTDEELDLYLKQHKLPNEHKYFDPTKVESNRECGLHT